MMGKLPLKRSEGSGPRSFRIELLGASWIDRWDITPKTIYAQDLPLDP